jgi:hypothetical protein
MDIQKWLNDQNTEAVQDRRDGKDYWMYDNLYTEIDLIELLEAFSLHVVSCSCADKEKQAYEKGWEDGAKVGADDVSSRM